MSFAIPHPRLRRQTAFYLVLILLPIVLHAPLVSGQTPSALARRWADARVQAEEVRFLLQAERISADEGRVRTTAVTNELAAIRAVVGRLPAAAQSDISREADTLFQVRIVPLRDEWNQALLQKRRTDQAADAARRTELAADAEQSGKLQADRTLRRERAQRGEITQAEFAQEDQAAEQNILAAHRKYDAYGPAWGQLFSNTEAAVAARALVEARLRLRLEDTQSDIGKDAHRAAEQTLLIQRTQAIQVSPMTSDETRQLDAVRAEVAALRQKYAGTSNGADFSERVSRLVATGAAAQRTEWTATHDAAAREAAAREVAAANEAREARYAAARDASARETSAREIAQRRPPVTATPAVQQASRENRPVGSDSRTSGGSPFGAPSSSRGAPQSAPGLGMTLLFAGIACVIPALALRFWLERRVFMRMSAGGVQQFESYGAVWKARLIEGPARLFMVLLALVGVIASVLGVLIMFK